ncbi:hypothetical protein C8R44DRAFT_727435 [Mycena epipterygia]|nr:hypothetical protein C8R44DRAFT_727435 [Mycena epipterygia]
MTSSEIFGKTLKAIAHFHHTSDSTVKLIKDQQGFCTFFAHVWTHLLQLGNCDVNLSNCGLYEVCYFLQLGMDAMNLAHLQELIDGTGGDLWDLVFVIIKFTCLLGPTTWDLSLNYLGHALALTQYIELVYPSFPEALIARGIFPVMMTVLCDFYVASPPQGATDSQSGILANTFKMVIRLLAIAPSFKLIIEAVDISLVETAMRMASQAFRKSAIFPCWQSFVGLVELRLKLKEIYDSVDYQSMQNTMDNSQHHTWAATRAGVSPAPPPVFNLSPVSISFGLIQAGDLLDMTHLAIEPSMAQPAAAAVAHSPASVGEEPVTSVTRNPVVSYAGETSSELTSLLNNSVDYGMLGDAPEPSGDKDAEGWTPVTRGTSQSHRERKSKRKTNTHNNDSSSSSDESTIAQATHELSRNELLTLVSCQEAYLAQLRAEFECKPVLASSQEQDTQFASSEISLGSESDQESELFLGPSNCPRETRRVSIEEVEDEEDFFGCKKSELPDLAMATRKGVRPLDCQAGTKWKSSTTGDQLMMMGSKMIYELERPKVRDGPGSSETEFSRNGTGSGKTEVWQIVRDGPDGPESPEFRSSEFGVRSSEFGVRLESECMDITAVQKPEVEGRCATMG